VSAKPFRRLGTKATVARAAPLSPAQSKILREVVNSHLGKSKCVTSFCWTSTVQVVDEAAKLSFGRGGSTRSTPPLYIPGRVNFHMNTVILHLLIIFIQTIRCGFL
jgi:hypothetical protein